MSNYTQIIDFSAKDALASGDPAKKIVGADVDAEFAAIATAIATKADDNVVVKTSGTQTVGGDKTFLGNNTHSGNNTFSGTNTFSGDNTFSGTITMAGKAINHAAPVDVASAATTDIGAAASNNVRITGTTTITSFGTANAGVTRKVRFADALTLTHNGTSLILPGSANITTEAGDTAEFLSLGSGNWVCTHYKKQGGIPTSFIANGAVTQSKLKTATASGSTNVPASGTNSVALTGGTYAWWTAGATGTAQFGAGNTAAGVLGLFNFSGSTATFYRDERYVQASPPYTHGPLFVFLLMSASGIEGVEVAPDPTWAYHGPTDITPQYWRNGKAYRREKRYNGRCLRECLKDETFKQQFLAGDVDVTEEELEITLAYKDSDKDVRPHPWCYNAPDSPFLLGKTVVMLEPGTSLMLRLHEMLEQSHANEVRELIHAGYLSVDNTALDLTTAPKGVMVCRATLK